MLKIMLFCLLSIKILFFLLLPEIYEFEKRQKKQNSILVLLLFEFNSAFRACPRPFLLAVRARKFKPDQKLKVRPEK